MFSFVSFFGAGVALQKKLSDWMPCKASMRCSHTASFKLTVCVHTVSLDAQGQQRRPPSSRPWVTLSTGSKTKRTEPGDWSPEEQLWRFQESMTAEVTAKEEAFISVLCPQQYDLGVAAVALSDRTLGDLCIHVASVIPQLQPEERDLDGLIYATQSISFDLHKDGSRTGRALLSFETKKPPPGRDEGEILTAR